MTGRGARSLAQGRWELGLLLRNGEQALLTLAIPVGLLVAVTLTPLLGLTVTSALPVVLTVSVIATCFTSLAIATGFERRSGALRFLATTPLSRGELLAGKAGATAGATLLSIGAVCLVGMLLGWRAVPGSLWATVAVLLGACAFAAWGFALAGLLRAEAVLAAANGIFVLLVLFGGVVIPATSLPGPLAGIAAVLPSGALASSLERALVSGQGPTLSAVTVLVAWCAAGGAVAARTFRWS